MTVELRPMGVACNIGCQYCYQNPQRVAGNAKARYDMEKMKQALDKTGERFTLFGGEPLLLPEEDLEELWSWGLKRFGSNGLQTNGTLITERHIEMFKKYKVSVGISCDGPGELNDLRWAGTLEATREASERTQHAIERLCHEGIVPSIIVTLHRYNATGAKLTTLVEWVCQMERLGVRAVRLHILEVDSPEVRMRCVLTDEENIASFLAFARVERELQTLRFDVFGDMRKLLMGKDHNVTCIWGACDPYTTAAVNGIEGHGQRSNCGRTNKDGIDFIKAEFPGYERYLALYQVPQQSGGCRDCRFFLMCKGQCPGTAIDGDWRNRTEHCGVWKTLYERFEAEMQLQTKTPISLHPMRRQMEEWFISEWTAGRRPSMESFMETNPAQFGA